MFLYKPEIEYYKSELKKRYGNLMAVLDNGVVEHGSASLDIDSEIAFLASKRYGFYSFGNSE